MEKICNVCGKKLDIFETDDTTCNISLYPGYGSKYDDSHISMNICFSCFDELFDSLKQKCVVQPEITY